MATSPITTTEYASSAHRYYGGTQNLGLWNGVGAAVDFLERIGMTVVHERCLELAAHLRSGLERHGNRVEILTPAESRSRAGITSLRIKGLAHDAFYKTCMAEKVRIRAVSENGVNALRVSTHIYNSKADVDRLLELVEKAV